MAGRVSSLHTRRLSHTTATCLSSNISSGRQPQVQPFGRGRAGAASATTVRGRGAAQIPSHPPPAWTREQCTRRQRQEHRTHRMACASAAAGDTAPSGNVRLHVTPEELWEEELVNNLGHLGEEEVAEVKRGLWVAYAAHDGQKRKSGEPYIIHPVAVARILADLHLDRESIIAGLLHDTVEDTDRVTFESIEAEFGTAVRRIVEGETKVSKVTGKLRKGVEAAAEAAAAAGGGNGAEPGAATAAAAKAFAAAAPGDDAADDMAQMLLAMGEEVRVIVVKLADRLHNMRTLDFMPAHKQRLIAQETLDVFAPLAGLLGMEVIRKELEQLSFPKRFPDGHAEVSRWMDVLAVQQEAAVLQAQAEVDRALAADAYVSQFVSRVEVQPRTKDAYQVHQKVKAGEVLLTEMRDVAQLLIILHLRPDPPFHQPSSQVCYHVMGLLHAVWPPIPGRMKDYIATPKPNGYRSLHTVVLPVGTQGTWDIFPLRLLIRTAAMHQVAELGIAAPTQGAAHAIDPRELEELTGQVKWLQSLKEWQTEFVGQLTPREFVDTITDDLLGARIFAFTPKGEALSLPKGATVVDYAYHIHTDVGNCMVGAKVNGRLASPAYQLRNADVVEVLTYDGPLSQRTIHMHRQWLRSAATRTAQHKIRMLLREWDRTHPPDPEEEALTEVLEAKLSAFRLETTVQQTTAGFEEDADSENMRKLESLSLLVRCDDRLGLLADVSGLIRKYDLFIMTYAGTTDPRSLCGVMNFELKGSTAGLIKLCSEIERVEGVLSFSCFSSVADRPQSPKTELGEEPGPSDAT